MLRGYGARYKLVSDKLRFYLGTLTLPEVKEDDRERERERYVQWYGVEETREMGDGKA